MRKLHNFSTLINEAVRLNWSRIKIYKKSLYIETVANILFVSMVLVFWEVIYSKFPNHQIGLKKEELYVYLAFVEIFHGLKQSFFPLTSKFWRIIYSGQMLSIMIRPIHPILLFLMNNLRLQQLLPPIPIIILLLIQGRAAWSFSSLISGLFVVLFGVLLVALLEITLCLFSFWITKMNALDEIVDSFMNFTKYPLTIFHYGWQIIFTVVFPFMFYTTIPSFVAILDKGISYYVLIIGILLIGIWYLLLRLLWKKGVRSYDGFSG